MLKGWGTLKCEIGSGILSCAVQHRMHFKGFVISYKSYEKGVFIKPDKMLLDDEVMSDSVDWRMLHNYGECLNTMKQLEPELYASFVKELKI